MNDKTKTLKVIFWAYLTIVGGYVLYGYIAKTGLYALLIDEQLKRFGKADANVAVIVPFIVLMLPIAPLARYVRAKDQKRRLQNVGPAAYAKGLTGPAADPEKRSQWVWLGVFAVVPFLISLIAYGYLTMQDSTDQKRSIFHMDLARNADLPAGDVKFIEIAGILQQDSGYRLIEDHSGMKTGESFAPLTTANWNPSQPVKYFLYLKSQGGDQIAIGHFDKQTGRYDVMPRSGPYNSSFGGKLSRNALPDYVKSALERRGVTATDPYYVLEWTGDLDRPVASQYNSQMYYLIPFFGAFFSMVILAGGGIAYVNRKRQRARVGL